jgi:hypothetical protein
MSHGGSGGETRGRDAPRMAVFVSVCAGCQAESSLKARVGVRRAVTDDRIAADQRLRNEPT